MLDSTTKLEAKPGLRKALLCDFIDGLNNKWNVLSEVFHFRKNELDRWPILSAIHSEKKVDMCLSEPSHDEYNVPLTFLLLSSLFIHLLWKWDNRRCSCVSLNGSLLLYLCKTRSFL